MKSSKLNPAKGIISVLLLCIAGYLISSSVISWSIDKYHLSVSKQPLESKHDKLKIEPDSPAFKLNDKVIFDFTGDTVLILGPGIDYKYDDNVYWRVLCKDEYEKVIEIDLPEDALIAIKD